MHLEADGDMPEPADRALLVSLARLAQPEPGGGEPPVTVSPETLAVGQGAPRADDFGEQALDALHGKGRHRGKPVSQTPVAGAVDFLAKQGSFSAAGTPGQDPLSDRVISIARRKQLRDMPYAVARAGYADRVMPLDDIGAALAGLA